MNISYDDTTTTMPQLQRVELARVIVSNLNPRSDPQTDLEGLTRSLGTEDAPQLEQYPSAQRLTDERYLLISGERRYRAASSLGWQTMPMMVWPAGSLSQTAIHNRRVIENLHRRELSPIDYALALKISYLLANARALGVESEASQILANTTDKPQAVRELEQLLAALGHSDSRPGVSWDTVLDELGIELEASRRRQILRVLKVAPDLHDTLRELALSEATARAIGTLTLDQQHELVGYLKEYPQLLAKKGKGEITSLVDAIRSGRLSVQQAVYEVLPDPVRSAADDDSDDGGEEGGGPSGSGRGNRANSSNHPNFYQNGNGGGRGGSSSSSSSGSFERGGGGGGGWSGGGGSDDEGGGSDLDDLSVEGLTPELSAELDEQLAARGVSEAGRRSIATLDPDDQQTLVATLLEYPHLAGKIRRIVKLRRDEGWALSEALDEALGWVGGKPLGAGSGAENATNFTSNSLYSENEQEPSSQLALVMPGSQDEILLEGTQKLLEAVSVLTESLDLLKQASPDGKLASLPYPWATHNLDSIQLMLSSLKEVGVALA